MRTTPNCIPSRVELVRPELRLEIISAAWFTFIPRGYLDTIPSVLIWRHFLYKDTRNAAVRRATGGDKNGEVQLVINTPLGAQSRFDEYDIGRSAIRYKIPAITTISGAQAAVRGIRNIKNGSIQYRSLQEVFG